MPNHVTNIIRSQPPVIHALLTEEGVDFNRIIPCPPDDESIFTASKHEHRSRDGEVAITGWSGDGYSPLDWAREHWGTKWNAYSDEVLENDTVVRFDTAWSHPYPVMIELSKRFPRVPIQVVYADEDLGSNFAAYIIDSGVISELPMPEEGTDEAADFASLVKYGVHYKDLGEDWEHESFDPLVVLNHALHAGGQ